jgi:hypothetical protein
MADRSFPDALKMRALRAGQTPEAERESVATALRAGGRNVQALLLYEGRAQHKALEDEQGRAVREGQVFILLSMRRLGRTVSDAELRQAAATAAARGHHLEARLALQALGDVEGVRAIAEHLPASLRPPPLPPATPAVSSSH